MLVVRDLHEPRTFLSIVDVEQRVLGTSFVRRIKDIKMELIPGKMRFASNSIPISITRPSNGDQQITT
jgi:hypothetical protein